MKFGRDDGPSRNEFGWWLFAAALILVLVTSLGSYLGWLVFGVFLYYVARPIARRLVGFGLPPGIAASVTLAVIVLPFIALLGTVAVIAFGQLSTVRVADVERLVRVLFPGFDFRAIPTTPERLYDSVTRLLRNPSIRSFLFQFRGLIGAFATQSYNLFLTLIFVFFLVRDEGKIAGWFRRTVADEETRTGEYLHAVDRGLNSVFFGYTLTIFVIIVLSAVIYTLLNLVAPPGMAIPQTMLVAIATGLATIVPLVGRSIVYFVVVFYLAIVALRTDPVLLWFPVLFLAIMEIAFDNAVRTYIRPILSGRLFPTGLIMFAYLLGPPVFGWYGIFLGPFIMVVTVQFLWVVFPGLLGRNPVETDDAPHDDRSDADPTPTDDRSE
ncbi:permease [Haladaptatus paucihalophilus DX253]|uniref:Permease n=1 Tax=Haladaptatus paucihalophilus DX253 TaxID=797209 RepID=E7QV10_HALPU|nr:AI-2E family transporter [Haladaptatus paucihalophilus]EFW91528.1 permease [Haladaptatus paucihalophilus DX253]SHL25587.1 Predicted PurR-regulated permease PerM [Haladaptatus paucihalophilus DX253]